MNRLPALTADAHFADKAPAADRAHADTRRADTPQAVALDNPGHVAIASTTVKEASAEVAPTLRNVEPAPAVHEAVPLQAVQEAEPLQAAVPLTAVHDAESTQAAGDTVSKEAEKKAEPIVTASLSDPSEALPSEALPEQGAVPAASEAAANPVAGTAKDNFDTTEILDECYVIDACVDRYLWALYQRTPKEDSVKEKSQKQVTVKRKGKVVTVTRTVSAVVDEDFAWKDKKAADNANMTMMDYVMGGVDRDFKLRLFHMLRAAEAAGLHPGITSAFRDDYRQSIASGLKAANDRSYHGGSSHGGYGHGLAADVVGVNGTTRTQRLASSEVLWQWIDKNGKQFGIGRPYLDRDPPHVAPIDGKEYADHHPAMRARQARAQARAVRSRPAPAGTAAGAAKRVQTARS